MSVPTAWSSDGEVSQPLPPEDGRRILVDFGGFAFTSGGICHNISEEEREAIFQPTFAPPQDDD